MDKETRIHSYLDKAWALRGVGNIMSSKKNLKNAQELCNEDDYEFLGRVFHIYRQYESDNNNYEKALQYNLKSLSYYKKANNLDRIAHSTRHLADLQVKLNEFDSAKENYEAAIKIYKESTDSNDLDLSNALRGFAELLELLGNLNSAIEIWNEVLIIYEMLQFEDGISEVKKRIKGLS